MKTIYKYPFGITDDFEIFMPEGARVLHVGMQYDRPCIWALVDPNAVQEERKFHLAGTGHSIEDKIADWQYVGTFTMQDGALVFHLFCEVPR